MDERSWPFGLRDAIEAKDLRQAALSCARRTSKSCACSHKPRRSPSGISRRSVANAAVYVFQKGMNSSVKRFFEKEQVED